MCHAESVGGDTTPLVVRGVPPSIPISPPPPPPSPPLPAAPPPLLLEEHRDHQLTVCAVRANHLSRQRWADGDVSKDHHRRVTKEVFRTSIRRIVVPDQVPSSDHTTRTRYGKLRTIHDNG